MSEPNAPMMVAVDGSDSATDALRWAAAAAVREHRDLTVVSVAGIVPAAYGPGVVMTYTEIKHAMRAEAQRVVDDAVRLVTESAPAPSVTGTVLEGTPALALREISTRAHTLIVGSRGRGGVKGLMLGSVSTDVVAHANCPVVVVSGPSAADGPVVVGVDGSPLSRAAVAEAFRQASLLNTSVLAVHTYGGSEQFVGL